MRSRVRLRSYHNVTLPPLVNPGPTASSIKSLASILRLASRAIVAADAARAPWPYDSCGADLPSSRLDDWSVSDEVGVKNSDIPAISAVASITTVATSTALAANPAITCVFAGVTTIVSSIAAVLALAPLASGCATTTISPTTVDVHTTEEIVHDDLDGTSVLSRGSVTAIRARVTGRSS
jgi:hypothetical protein